MREYGSVSIPQEAFIAALRMGGVGDCFSRLLHRQLAKRKNRSDRRRRPR